MGTIGRTIAGGTDGLCNTILAMQITTPGAGDTITSISAYLKNTAADSPCGVAIYADSGGTDLPTTFLVEDTGNQTISGAAFAWYTWTITYAFPANTKLWLAFWSQNTTDIWYSYDADAQLLAYNFTVTAWETYPAPAGASNNIGRLVSIYATYGAAPATAPMFRGS